MISSRIIDTPEGEVKPWAVLSIADANAAEAELSDEELIEAAKAEGFEAGYAAGMQKAGEEIQRACAERNQQLDILLQTLATPALTIDEQLEQDLVSLTLSVARQIVQVELRSNPEAVHVLVREALDKLPPNDAPIQLHLHPDDAPVIAELIADKSLARPLEIIASDTIVRGGCLVNSGPATVDASAARIDELLEQQAAQALSGTGAP